MKTKNKFKINNSIDHSKRSNGPIYVTNNDL